MTIFFMLRHAQSEANVSRIIAGRTISTSLTALGRKQANNAAELLARVGVDVVYSSPMLRTRETAQIICKRLGLNYLVDSRLQEIEVGSLLGRNLEEMSAEDPGWSMEMYKTGSGRHGLEKHSSILSRMLSLLKEIASLYPSGRAALVSHVETMKPVITFALGAPPETAMNFPILNAALTILKNENEKLQLIALNVQEPEDYAVKPPSSD